MQVLYSRVSADVHTLAALVTAALQASSRHIKNVGKNQISNIKITVVGAPALDNNYDYYGHAGDRSTSLHSVARHK
jgi:hypothetical protein